MTEAFQALVAIAATVTGVTALIRRFVETKWTPPTVVWQSFAFVAALAYCLGWNVNVVPLFAGLVPALADQAASLDETTGEVMTALAAGALSGFLHDGFDFIRSKTG